MALDSDRRVVSVVMLGTALVGGSAYWLYRHVNTRFTSHELSSAGQDSSST